MVDCGRRRCAQERRSLRRDLQSLSKKLPVILGLESIASVFAKEHDSDEKHPLEDTNQLCRDFQSSNHCFYCEKKLPNIYKRIHRIIDDAENGKENKGKLCLRSLQDLIPFCLDFYTQGFGRELFSDCVKNYFTAVSQSTQEVEPRSSCPSFSASCSTDLTRPLNIPSTNIDNAQPSSLPSLPTLSNSLKPSSSSRFIDVKRDCKRDALSMIHRHRMPESIMDAKGIKQEPESDTHVLPHEAADFYNMFLSQLPTMDSREKNHQSVDFKDIFPFALPNFLASSSLGHPAYLSPDTTLLKEFQLSQIRRMHNLGGANKTQPPPAHGSQLKMPLLIDIVRKLVREKFMEVKKHHRKGSLMTDDSFDDEEMMPEPPRAPFMPFPLSLFSLGYQENERLADSRNGSQFSNIASDDKLQLKHFGKVNECSRIGSTLKDIIVKSIAEKVKFKNDSSDENSCPSSPNFSDSRQLNKSSLSQGYFNSIPNINLKSYKNDKASTSQFDNDYSCSPPKRQKRDGSKSNKGSPSPSKKSPDIGASPPSVKKTRPKRGQYRKYNSQLLMDAVRAVQSGEMSVHRAGSFFGVPHSTLEYKVKERHLLRQKKIKDSRASPVSSSSPKSDHQQSSLRLTIDLSRDSSPALSEASVCTTPSLKKSSDPLPSSSVVNLDKKKPVSFLDQKAPNQPSPTPAPALSPSPCASVNLNNNNGKKDIPLSPSTTSATWLQPYLCSGSSSAKDVPDAIQQRSLAASLSLDNSASELLRKLQHKVQTNSKLSFTPPNDSSSAAPSMASLPANDVYDGVEGTSTLAGRFPLFNQSV